MTNGLMDKYGTCNTWLTLSVKQIAFVNVFMEQQSEEGSR
tara:strand:- start:331 stop:450 length:120 start_codon:yes stop_codon:yes gene_type:complete